MADLKNRKVSSFLYFSTFFSVLPCLYDKDANKKGLHDG